MDTRKIEIMTRYVVREVDVCDIIASALYGGIGYWCPRVATQGKSLGESDCYDENCGEHLWRGGTLLFYEDAEEDGVEEHYVEHKMVIDDFLKGLKKWMEEYAYAPPTDEMNGTLYLDCGQIDSNDADSIVQLAVFGKLVYG